MPLLSILRRLDWKTSVRGSDLRTHWRIHVCDLVGAAIGFGIVHAAYPHAFWFFALWCGGVIGQAAGLVVGSAWQLASPARVPRTAGKFIALGVFATAFFMSFALLELLPLMRAQETERAAFHALAAEDIVAIAAHGRCVDRKIDGSEAIGRVRRLIATSELYFPSHESTTADFTVSFLRAHGAPVEYPARALERHPLDVAVRTGKGEMLIEGLRPLLQIDADSPGAACR